MIVDDLDVMSVVIDPPEADAPLVVDADAHLPGPAASERLQPIARWIGQGLDPRDASS